MLGKVFGTTPLELPLQRIFTGRKHAYTHRCCSGALYGVSGDVASWMSKHENPFKRTSAEDLTMCGLMDEFDNDANRHGLPALNRASIMDPHARENKDTSIHHLKKDNLLLACFQDTEGCSNHKSKGKVDGHEHMMLSLRPGSIPAQLGAAIASTKQLDDGNCTRYQKTSNALAVFLTREYEMG